VRRLDVGEWLAAVLWCTACDARAPVAADAAIAIDAAADRLVLGTSDVDGNGFQMLAGDQVLVSGPQGGFHVWLKLRIAGLAPGPFKVRRIAERAADQTLLLDAESILQVGAAAGDYWEQPYPVPLFLCPTPSSVSVVDQRIELHVVLRSSSAIDVLGDANASFTVHCPDSARAACMELCSG